MLQKPKILLIGGGGHCKACIDVIEIEGRYDIAGIVDIPEKKGESILGYKIIGDDEELENLIKKYKNVLVSVGYIKSPKIRKELFKRAKSFGAIFPVIVSPNAHVSIHAQIEEGTIIMHGAVVNAGASIGTNSIVNNLALVEHDVVIGNNCHISTGARINGNCYIGNDCFVGSGSIINQGITINDNLLIGSGSLVRKDITDGGVYAGNPLKKYK